MAINCGGIPDDLVAAELFGHEKGAFTGAHQRRPGRIEMADGGTLFLDEIGDFPLHLQPHLLRFLQEGTFERVGGLETLRVTTRIIAATNVDLEQAVEEKRFRRDLFFRLNVLRLHLPPLRERGDDVTLLARYYIDRPPSCPWQAVGAPDAGGSGGHSQSSLARECAPTHQRPKARADVMQAWAHHRRRSRADRGTEHGRWRYAAFPGGCSRRR